MTPILLAFVSVKIAVILGNGKPGGMPQPVRVVMLTLVECARNGHEPNLVARIHNSPRIPLFLLDFISCIA